MTAPHTDALALKPCPFCGCSKVDPEGWASKTRSGPACEECSATADSAEAWNRRAALTAEPKALIDALLAGCDAYASEQSRWRGAMDGSETPPDPSHVSVPRAALEAYIASLTAERDALADALTDIGDFAHGRSSGPTVPDDLWEVRRMAYDGLPPPPTRPANGVRDGT